MVGKFGTLLDKISHLVECKQTDKILAALEIFPSPVYLKLALLFPSLVATARKGGSLFNCYTIESEDESGGLALWYKSKESSELPEIPAKQHSGVSPLKNTL